MDILSEALSEGRRFRVLRIVDHFSRVSPSIDVEAFLDVRNILDEYYEEDPGKAAPGRIVWGGIRAEF